MVFIRRDIRKQKLRQQTSEHPFGTIKHYDDGRHFLCRGKEKVTAEFALSALSYNIRRAIALCSGVPKLIERYRRIVMPKIQKNRGNLREKPLFFRDFGLFAASGWKSGWKEKINHRESPCFSVVSLVRSTGLEPVRSPTRPSNVRVCLFRHDREHLYYNE